MDRIRPCQAVSLLLLAAAQGVNLRPGARAVTSRPVDSDLASAEHFDAFVRKNGRTYRAGSEEYSARLALFQARAAAVAAQNADPARRWTAAVNGLADRTAAELAALRGYRHGARAAGAWGLQAAAGGAPVGLVSAASRAVNVSKLPDNFSWQPHLGAMQAVVDQGACGSCWAVSSATVLRAHTQLFQVERQVSAQQIVACAPNPRHCGGTGGCMGATAELAMDYAARQGLGTESDMPYEGPGGSCPAALKEVPQQSQSLRQFNGDTAFLTELSIEGGGAEFGMVGWKKLPENKAEPLLLAVYEEGPVVVSVAASDAWNMYSSGVMSGCRKDAIINHAVVLTGFGIEGELSYWQIQNSWGPGWGEGGFVRLLRHGTPQEEESYCGWDTSPEEGTACKGGPARVRVCGSCGVLYDSVVPKFRLSAQGWWHTHGNRSLQGAA